MKAAVVHSFDQPLVIQDRAIPEPQLMPFSTAVRAQRAQCCGWTGSRGQKISSTHSPERERYRLALV